MFEIYESTEGRKKTFLVFSGYETPDVAFAAARKYFKCAEHHLGCKACWILNDELYFEYPQDSNATKQVTIFWK